jgi:hypothetical protein
MVSTINLLGCSATVALTMGPTDEEEEEEVNVPRVHDSGTGWW